MRRQSFSTRPTEKKTINLAKVFAVPLFLVPSALFTACNDPDVPQLNGPDQEAVIPDFVPDTRGSAKSMMLSADDAAASSDDAEEAGECLEWIPLEVSTNNETGEFVYRYKCPEGGNIAETHTVGQDNLQGAGSYTYTIIMRDNSQVVWEYTYYVASDGMTQIMDGSSDQGSTHHSERTWLPDGTMLLDDSWQVPEGSYEVDGSYDTLNRFSGTTVFDDPATDFSPDGVYEQVHNDLVFSQHSYGVWENIQYNTNYVVSANGADYDFVHDYLDTLASPDFEGSYHYEMDGSGTGSYTQRFNDGSILFANDAGPGDGSMTRAWTYDDVATELNPDQEGVINYNADGSGTGEVTFFFGDGESQTCQLTIEVDGTNSLTACQ